MLQNLLNVFNSIFGPIIIFIMGFIVASFLIARHSRKIVSKEMAIGGEEYGERASTKINQFMTTIIILSIVVFIAIIIGIVWYSVAV